jgi:hypothetical protein
MAVAPNAMMRRGGTVFAPDWLGLMLFDRRASRKDELDSDAWF